MDGHQLARHLRQQPPLKEAILIAITGFADKALRIQWEGAFDHYLVKPVDAEDLQKLLAALQRVIQLPQPQHPHDTLKASYSFPIPVGGVKQQRIVGGKAVWCIEI